MKKIFKLYFLILFLFAFSSCKKEDPTLEIIPEKLTSYIWAGEEYSGFSGSYFVSQKVAYNFSKESDGAQTCRKTVIEGLEKTYFYGTWKLDGKKVIIDYTEDLPDYKVFNEILEIIELTDQRFRFKRPDNTTRMGSTEKIYKANKK